MLDAGEPTMMDVPGGKERLDKIMGLPNFPTQLSNLLMRIPELSL